MRSTDAVASRRVLIADDQPDVVAALRLLLRGAGLETDAACLSAGSPRPIERADYDLLLMDLELRARHHVGTRRARAAERSPRARSSAADHRHDRLGEHRDGRRRDAPRRAHLRAQAMGEHLARRDRDRVNSTTAARATEADAHASRELEDAQRIQRALLPVSAARDRRLRDGRTVEPGDRRSAAIATTCCASRPRGSGSRLPTSPERDFRRRC